MQLFVLFLIINIIYSECMSVALSIQYEKPMDRRILSSLACSVVSHFSILSYERHDFWEKKASLNRKMCLIFCANFFRNNSAIQQTRLKFKFVQITADCSEKLKKNVNTICGQMRNFLMLNELVPAVTTGL
jgi:hypothetical protein